MSKTKKPTKDALLAEASAAKKAAVDALAAETKRSEEIDSLHIDSISLPRADAVLSYLPSAVETLKKEEEKIDGLIEKAKMVEGSLKAFEEVERQCEFILYETRLLVEAGHYEEASTTISEFSEYWNLDYGVELKFEGLLHEIHDWTMAKIRLLDEQHRLFAHQESLPKDALFALKEDAKKLPTQYHTEKDKLSYIDQAFYVLGLYYQTLGEISSPEELSERFVEINDFTSCVSPTPATKEVYEELRKDAIDAYVRLSFLYGQKNAKYEDALTLFRIRSNIPEGTEMNPLFLGPKDEKEFRLAFLRNVCRFQEDEEFAQYALTLRSSLEFDNPESSALVALLFADASMSEKKQTTLHELFKALTFERKIDVFSNVLLEEVPEPVVQSLFLALRDSKKKALDLEKKADALLTIRDHLPKSLRKDYKRLIAALLRSPLAKKTITKSANPALHALAGHKENFKMPVGKKARDTYVNSWGKAKNGAFVFFLIILPILLLAANVYYLVVYQQTSPFYPFYLLVPIALLAMLVIAITYGYAGRDERPSAVVRRLFAVVGILAAVASALYYLLPAYTSFLAPYEYTLIISGAFFLLAGHVLLKDFHKRWNFILNLPLALIELLDVVLLLLRLMNRL